MLQIPIDKRLYLVTRGAMTDELSVNIRSILDYANKLQGIPYGWWGGNEIETESPMWAVDEPPPSESEITSCNCAGLVNLLLRRIGKPLPTNPFAKEHGKGGTAAYLSYYRDHLAVCEKFDIETKYPIGSLLIRGFRDIHDQVHLAVLLDGKGVESRVLQSFALGYPSTGPGINCNFTLEQSHAGYFYEYVVLPENWLI